MFRCAGSRGLSSLVGVHRVETVAPFLLTSFGDERSKALRRIAVKSPASNRNRKIFFASFWSPKKEAMASFLGDQKEAKNIFRFLLLAGDFTAIRRRALLLSSPKEVSKKGATVSTRWTPTRELSPLDPAQRNTYRVLPPPASARPTLRAGGAGLSAAARVQYQVD